MGAVIDGDEDHLIAAFREVQLTTDGSMGAVIDPFFHEVQLMAHHR